MAIELKTNKSNLSFSSKQVIAVEEVYVGEEAPTEDKGYKVWVDTNVESLPELATKEYVDEAIANVDISGIDLTGYATEEYVNEAVKNVEVDLTGYATEDYVKSAIEAIEIPEVDLSDYALKSEIPDVSGFKTEEEIIALIEEHGGGGEVLPAAEGVEF